MRPDNKKFKGFVLIIYKIIFFFFLGLFSPLVKLLVSHYPQLCLVEDWLYQSPSADSRLGILPPRVALDPLSVTRGLYPFSF